MRHALASGSKADGADVCSTARAVCACLLLRPLGCHALSEPGLQLLQVGLHLVHLVQAGVQVCMVLVQQVQVGGQPGSTVLLHGGAPLLPGP